MVADVKTYLSSLIMNLYIFLYYIFYHYHKKICYIFWLFSEKLGKFEQNDIFINTTSVVL